jgi:methionyl-tRNA synthetase
MLNLAVNVVTSGFKNIEKKGEIENSNILQIYDVSTAKYLPVSSSPRILHR